MHGMGSIKLRRTRDKEGVHTDVLNMRNKFEDVPSMYDAWSNPVTHDEEFLVPRYLVGINAARFGSNDPVSSM